MPRIVMPDPAIDWCWQSAVWYFRDCGVEAFVLRRQEFPPGWPPTVLLKEPDGREVLATAAAAEPIEAFETVWLAAEWHFLSGRGNGAVLAYPPAE
jgi:hypothetical protein